MNIDQKSIKNQPKINLGGVSGGPWGLLAAKIEKRRLRPQLLWPLGAILGPSWGPLGAVLALGSPSWGVLGRLGALLSRLKIDVKNRCLSRSVFGAILVDFWKENGGKLAPNSEPKSMLPLKRKNQLNASPLAPNWVRGVQVGSKNR